MIKILRKKGSSLSWMVNSLFTAAFPLEKDEFEIPNINWMAYLSKDFEVIEYTDVNGVPLDITTTGMPCWFRKKDLENVKVVEVSEEAKVDAFLNLPKNMNSSKVKKENK
jgi:hypothetical protein